MSSSKIENDNQTAHYKKMTEAKVEPLIIKMTIPTVISMLITNIYNLADTAFVGQLGTSASGAVGVVFGFMAILQAIGYLFGQGAGSIVARRLGARDVEAANKAVSTALFYAIVSGSVIAIICLVNINPLIMLLGSTETIAPYAKIYITYILLSMPFAVAAFALNNIIRYEGRAFLGMIGLMTGAILNIFGDALFIFVFRMGIAGAGLSTCLSQIVSFLILFFMFLKGKSQCTLGLKYITVNIKLFSDIVGNGMPSMLRQGLNSLVTIILNMEAAAYGDAAVAAMSIVSRIVFFVFSISLGIGQGFQSVCGFNYGAKKFSRVRKGYRFSFLVGEILMIVLCVSASLFADDIVRLFQADPQVVEIGTRALILQLISQIALPVCVLTELVLQSTGKKLHASILSSLKAGVIFIPLLLIMANLRGLAGIQEAQPLSNLLVVIPGILYTYAFFRKLPKEDGSSK